MLGRNSNKTPKRTRKRYAKRSGSTHFGNSTARQSTMRRSGSSAFIGGNSYFRQSPVRIGGGSGMYGSGFYGGGASFGGGMGGGSFVGGNGGGMQEAVTTVTATQAPTQSASNIQMIPVVEDVVVDDGPDWIPVPMPSGPDPNLAALLSKLGDLENRMNRPKRDTGALDRLRLKIENLQILNSNLDQQCNFAKEKFRKQESECCRLREENRGLLGRITDLERELARKGSDGVGKIAGLEAENWALKQRIKDLEDALRRAQEDGDKRMRDKVGDLMKQIQDLKNRPLPEPVVKKITVVERDTSGIEELQDLLMKANRDGAKLAQGIRDDYERKLDGLRDELQAARNKKPEIRIEKEIVKVPVQVPVDRPYKVEVPVPVERIVEKRIEVPVIQEKIVFRDREVPVDRPVRVEVPVEKIVYQDRPVPVEVPQPYPVDRPYPVKVEVEVPVDRPVPYPVEKIVDRPYPVEVERIVHVDRPVPEPYPVEIEKPVYVDRHIPEPYAVEVERPVYVDVPYPEPYPVEVEIDRPVYVDRYVPEPYPVQVEVDRPYPVKVPEPYAVEVEVEKPYPVQVDRPYPVQVDRPYPVEVDRYVPVEVEKPYPVQVQVPQPYPVIQNQIKRFQPVTQVTGAPLTSSLLLSPSLAGGVGYGAGYGAGARGFGTGVGTSYVGTTGFGAGARVLGSGGFKQPTRMIGGGGVRHTGARGGGIYTTAGAGVNRGRAGAGYLGASLLGGYGATGARQRSTSGGRRVGGTVVGRNTITSGLKRKF